MNQRNTLLTGIAFAGLAVAVGAFGAHGLKDMLVANSRTETFELAVKYQFYHAFALIFTGMFMRDAYPATMHYAAICFLFGIVLFSGSLYALSVSGITMLGAVTPIGGLLFIAGWVLLFASIFRNKKGLF